ncbi:lysophospholipase [Pseudovibrio japonicus]|uniref:Lysophospholipase n=1 Tax=Pseudovibrio japonicus TaxID=366534 RepID=A0ABQ3E787_9HYPH|nr:alpha/beta fold hydrolase [Pseudovibrio japonicus]GHB27303.1 lysophospholipase [Pseudovibrio japonicus]
MIFRFIVIAVLILLVGGTIAYLVGPREPRDTEITFKPDVMGEDLDQYLSNSEAKFQDIRDGTAKEIIWFNDEKNSKTPLSVIYIHGFSSSKQSIRPVPDRVANEMGANLFYTRLAGHGRSNDAMAEATLNDWINDLAEAVEIGRRIGEKTIIISTSTGSTLAAWLAMQDHPLKDDIAAMVFVSPNFAINSPGAFLLDMPFARQYVPLILGKTRTTSEAPTPEELMGWTISYPTTALLPLATAISVLQEQDPAKATIPTLFIYSENDKTVDASQTNIAYEKWSAPKQRLLIESSGDDDDHLIVGDIVSPQNNDLVISTTIKWLHDQLQ